LTFGQQGACKEALAARATTLGLLPPGGSAVLQPADCGDPIGCSATITASDLAALTEPVHGAGAPAIDEDGTAAVDDPGRLADTPDDAGKPETTAPEAIETAETAHDALAHNESTSLQVDAIRMYNAREPGWESVVEAALDHPDLRNAPNLAYAGLEPAYEEHRFDEVLRRAQVIWSNLDKGYLQADEQKTFVTEYACRADFQNYMQGKGSEDDARWCRLWMERLQRAGKDASEARDLLSQME